MTINRHICPYERIDIVATPPRTGTNHHLTFSVRAVDDLGHVVAADENDRRPGRVPRGCDTHDSLTTRAPDLSSGNGGLLHRLPG
jgi:hypothetical protein